MNGKGEHRKFAAEAKRLVYKWRKILNLQDWRIKVMMEVGDLPGGNGEEYACIFHSFQQHSAAIHIRTPDQWHEIDGGRMERDLETLVVHELIHLHMTKFFPRKNLLKAEHAELCINQLTDAFLGLSRENEKLIKKGE